MYKLLIADDEAIIRNGLQNFVDWARMGFEVVAALDDGEAVIETIRHTPVDALLVDIRMNAMTGLDVARYVFEHKLDIPVVLLSGYQEFEYARQAVAWNVKEYLVKPVKLEALERVFIGLREQLDQRAQQHLKQRARTRAYEDILPQLREEFFVNLLTGAIRLDEIEKRLIFLHLTLNPQHVLCMLFDVSLEDADLGASGTRPIQADDLGNLVQNLFRTDDSTLVFVPLFFSSRSIKVLAMAPEERDQTRFMQTVRARMADIQAFAGESLGCMLNVRAGPCREGLYALSGEAYHMEDDLQGSPMDATPEEHAPRRTLAKADYAGLQQRYRMLLACLREEKYEEVDTLLTHVLQEMQTLPLAAVQAQMVALFSLITSHYTDLGASEWALLHRQLDSASLIAAQDHQQLTQQTLLMLREAIQTLSRSQKPVLNRIVQTAERYLQTHYHEDISMESVADMLSVTPAYFSRLFKQHMGVSFTHRLFETRMKRAVDMLLQGRYKVYEISERVGYRSEKYFFRAFKQYTGRSPAEYARQQKEASHAGEAP